MSTLLDFRDGVKNFCSKYDKFVSPLCKFILALVVFWSINHLTGYNSTISSIVVALAAAFVCAFLSGQLTLAIAGLYACAQVASASLELGISFVVIFVIMYCVYIRFFPKASWIILFMPFFYIIKFQYFMPILAGMTAGFTGMVPAAFGCIFYFFLKHTADYVALSSSSAEGDLIEGYKYIFQHLVQAGAFHGVTEGDCVINVGVSGPGVVKKALEKVRGENFEELCETIKKTAFKVTRVGQLVAKEASKMLGVPFGIVDLSLAPTPAVGDSVGEILEEIGLEYAGAPGTTAALALLNDQVKKGGVMASSYVGGLSGAFIPVSEDQRMIDAVSAGALTLEKLEAMTCVCSVGLDMIAIPGDTSPATISGIIADEMALGMINQKTTAVRLIPVIGKTVGDQAEFGGLLGYAPIMPVNRFACDKFVNRGGRIPAPIHSFKN